MNDPWQKCPRCKAEILRSVFDGHFEWCQKQPRPEVVAKEHGEKFKIRIHKQGATIKSTRYNFSCDCGVDGKVWYSTKDAIYQAIDIHRKFPRLG